MAFRPDTVFVGVPSTKHACIMPVRLAFAPQMLKAPPRMSPSIIERTPTARLVAPFTASNPCIARPPSCPTLLGLVSRSQGVRIPANAKPDNAAPDNAATPPSQSPCRNESTPLSAPPTICVERKAVINAPPPGTNINARLAIPPIVAPN